MGECDFCERYATLREIYKWKKTENNYIRHYFRIAIVVKTFNKFGSCGRYTTRSMKLKYCPLCGRKLTDKGGD